MGSHAPCPSAPDGLSHLLPLLASHPVSPSLESYVLLWGVSIYSVAGRHWEGGGSNIDPTGLVSAGTHLGRLAHVAAQHNAWAGAQVSFVLLHSPC